MSFYLKIGSYTTDPCTARDVRKTATPVTVNDFVVSHIVSIQIEVWLYDTGPAALTTKIQALQNACATVGFDGGLMSSAGATSHYLTNASVIGQTRATLEIIGGDLSYATQVKCAVTIEGEVPNTYESKSIVQLNESVTILGEGGPDTALAPQAGAPSVFQTLSDYTDVQVVQEGTIAGRFGYPSMPNPLVTTTYARKVKLTRDRKTVEQVGTGIRLYRRDYGYTFFLPAHPGIVNPNLLT